MAALLARSLASVLVVMILSEISGAALGTDEEKPRADPRNMVKGKAAEDVVTLKLGVDVLEKLYHLELNARQLSALLKLAEKTAARLPATRELQAGEEYRSILKTLHDALLSQDEDRIHGLSEKLDELQEKETISIHDEFEMTDAALADAPQAFRLLSAAQIVAYLASLDDEVPDPVERILSALEEGEELDEEEWKELRNETAEEVAWLVAGFNTDNAAKAKKAVTGLLDRGHRLQGEELSKQWPDLEKAAGQLVGNVSSLVVLQHYMERELAELLSNPRTAAALRSWLKQIKE